MAAPRGPGPATPGPLPPGPSGLAWSWLLSTLLLLFPLSLSNSCSSSPHLLERFLHPSLPPHPFSGPARLPPGLSTRRCPAQSPPSHCCVLLVVPPESSSRSKTFNGSRGPSQEEKTPPHRQAPAPLSPLPAQFRASLHRWHRALCLYSAAPLGVAPPPVCSFPVCGACPPPQIPS